MTVLSTTRIAPDDSRLVARCEPCGQVLQSLDGFDHDVALGTFYQHHPSSADALHRFGVPAGWQPA